jgi:hypothetical protein
MYLPAMCILIREKKPLRIPPLVCPPEPRNGNIHIDIAKRTTSSFNTKARDDIKTKRDLMSRA